MNVLIIGLGSIAKKHIQALLTINKDVSIYALRSGEHPSEVLHVHNISSIGEPGVLFDFAIISNPTFAHYITIEQLVHLKIPLFIEKPLFHSVQGGEELIALCNKNEIRTYVACNLRFHPCILFLKELLLKEKKKVNEVNVYCGSYLPDWRPGTDFRKIYSANSDMGGGVNLDLIHELDYVSWLWGQPVSTQRILRSNSSLNINAVDYANYLLSYDQFAVNIILNYFRVDTKRTCEIVLEDRTILADLISQKVWSNEQLIFSSDVQIQYTYEQQMMYFLSLLDNKLLPNMNNIEEAFQVLKICLGDE
ncbi:putative dehydrogenase [Chitinophaga niastensis]|uniref:Putative dehydrogenase n=1 Tax=Chitinophaga niastensis TaxID=536980 RepID=A0A2P8HRU2_CHINA|nr:Gfo/Idh/MocA family oxidoreductase [Chitinophaga niastensis]PSL48946.1 putative dehydrogenase [Chitinophaga niastensis]